MNRLKQSKLTNLFQLQDKNGVMDAVKVLFRYAKEKAHQNIGAVKEIAQKTMEKAHQLSGYVKKTVQESRLLQFVLLVIFLSLLAYFVGPYVLPYVRAFAVWMVKMVKIILEFLYGTARAAFEFASAAFRSASGYAQAAFEWASGYLMWAIETAIECGQQAMNISYEAFMTVKDFAIEFFPTVKNILIELAGMADDEVFGKAVHTILKEGNEFTHLVPIILSVLVLPSASAA